MTLPTGMMRHPKTGMLWARKDVPRALRFFIGKTSLKKSLGTKDLGRAREQFHRVMRDFEAQLSAARASLTQETPLAFRTFTLDLPTDVAKSWALSESLKPQNQLKAVTERIEQQLRDAGLTAKIPEQTSVNQLFEKWKAERQPGFESQLEYERAKMQFVSLVGEKPIVDYTVVDARSWKEHVLSMRDSKGRTMAFATYAKNFSMVKTLFEYADRNDLLVLNPFSKIRLERPKRPKKSARHDWDESELQTWFNSPIYTDRYRPRGGDGEAAYWLPILALFHGFRAGELCQLDRADVVARNGIMCLRMSPSDDSEMAARKSFKNENSLRLVPVHARVIKLGFLEYVKSVNSRKLFPLIKPDARGRWSGAYSKWFGNYRKKIGLNERFKDFHSLRHTWKTHARGALLPEEIHDEISGHETASIGRTYGKYPISTLKEYVDKVRFNVRIPKWTAEP